MIGTETPVFLKLFLFTTPKITLRNARIYKVIKFNAHQYKCSLYLRRTVYLPPVVYSKQKVLPLIRYKMTNSISRIGKRILRTRLIFVRVLSKQLSYFEYVTLH